MAHNDYKVLGKGRLNDPIIGHPAMKGRRWMIDYGYDSGKTFKKLKDESMEYKDYFSEFETDDTSSNKLQGGVGDATASSDVNTAELAIGVQVEMEHTNDPNIATEIALDRYTDRRTAHQPNGSDFPPRQESDHESPPPRASRAASARRVDSPDRSPHWRRRHRSSSGRPGR